MEAKESEMKNGEVVKLIDVHKTYHTGDVDVHAVLGSVKAPLRGPYGLRA